MMREQRSPVMLHLLLTALLFARDLKDVDCSPVPVVNNDVNKTAVPQEEWLISAMHYMETNPETLQELLGRDATMLEGDMIMLSDRNAVETTWPTLDIAYLISPELAGRTEDILTAIRMVSESSCVTFHTRTDEPHYLIFKKNKGCASYVGFIGGEQPVFVAPQCGVGNIVHEILHALGFHHEHTRTDRERHITIFPDNIMKGMQRNFHRQQGNTFGLPYDIKSIMHYGRWFFSTNGQPTIEPLQKAEEMGQRVRMTELDIQRVKHLYNCDTMKKTSGKGGGEMVKETNGTNTGNQKDTSSVNPGVKVPLSEGGNQNNPNAANTRTSAAQQYWDSATLGHNNTTNSTLNK